MNVIVDGTGQGHRLKVNSDNSMSVTAVSKPEMVSVSELTQEAYIFANGGFPTVAASTESAMLYVKNDSIDKYLHLFSFRSCATQISKWRVYTDITGGTIISGATPGLENNLNRASVNTCDCTVYSGSSGVTATGGKMFEHWINDVGHSIEEFGGAIILGPENSVTLTVEVDIDAEVCCRIIGYYLEI